MKRYFCLLLVVLSLLTVPVSAVDMDIPAKSAVLMDVTTGTVLYEENAHTPLAPASVTKVMTMLLIMEAIDSGRIHWDDMVTASEAAAAKGGDEDSQRHSGAGEYADDGVRGLRAAAANNAEENREHHSEDDCHPGGFGQTADAADGDTGEGGVA